MTQDANDDQTRVLALSQDGSLRVFNAQNESLEEINSVSITPGASSFATGDFNRDGLTDLAVANLNRELIELYIGNGSGQFALVTTVNNVPTPSDLVVADLNNDLADDIAVASFYQTAQGNYSLPSSATILLVDVAQSGIVVTGNGTANGRFHLPKCRS